MSDVYTKAAYGQVLVEIIEVQMVSVFGAWSLRPNAPFVPEDSPSSHWPNSGIMVNVCHIPETVEIV